jgi:hypothetical protein
MKIPCSLSRCSDLAELDKGHLIDSCCYYCCCSGCHQLGYPCDDWESALKSWYRNSDISLIIFYGESPI